jgi:hypothetical protein
MKYEDIVTERTRLATKKADAATKTNSKKRKRPDAVKAQTKKARRSEIEVAEDEIVAGEMSEYCSVFRAGNRP